MRHLYECPTRWADLDMLGHVNNVTYVDYLQEARVDFMRSILTPTEADQDLSEGAVVVRHEVSYVHPLVFGFSPVQIECWVTDVRASRFTMAYEVFHEDPEAPGGRRVYLRATSVLAPFVFATERPRRLSPLERTALGPYLEGSDLEPTARCGRIDLDGPHLFEFPVHVRFSDVDVYRHVNNVKYFEYLQESRIRLIHDLAAGRDLPAMSFVVGATDVDYVTPILLRGEPYRVVSEISRVGQRSMTVDSEILDGERTLARARVVVVFFDLETQQSTNPHPVVRQRLLDLVRPL
ncbi:hypothetical protein GCM10027020_16620 [Nocardioides salsibiostraticola]